MPFIAAFNPPKYISAVQAPAMLITKSIAKGCETVRTELIPSQSAKQPLPVIKSLAAIVSDKKLINMILDKKGKQLSPCIVAKVRHAFGFTDKRPANNKRCSFEYWERTSSVIGKGLSKDEIARALRLYARYNP